MLSLAAADLRRPSSRCVPGPKSSGALTLKSRPRTIFGAHRICRRSRGRWDLREAQYVTLACTPSEETHSQRTVAFCCCRVMSNTYLLPGSDQLFMITARNLLQSRNSGRHFLPLTSYTTRLLVQLVPLSLPMSGPSSSIQKGATAEPVLPFVLATLGAPSSPLSSPS